MENSIINSLKRLERVGGEHSRVTEKLKKACCEVGKKIIETIKDYCEDGTANYYGNWKDVSLPRGYRAILIDTEDTCMWTIIVKDQDVYYDPPYNRSLAFASEDIIRSDALLFAKDISEGLLEEIAIWFENKIENTKKAITQIENK